MIVLMIMILCVIIIFIMNNHNVYSFIFENVHTFLIEALILLNYYHTFILNPLLHVYHHYD
jgi:hypothetical protein